ncbi:hypothetical protein L905_19360 [Agrobacterium sp. TS43]|nr:hypothetical protein K538_23605 [Agrobacterium tumefaciens GW4]KVK45415.1 hypothetical protein L904_25930 [Agrobacterium sp. LY4]KVK45490.1 hypothetical protein L903_25945 [Agrobacterium sp. JL28]KVK58999.1 hypothetical protein L906_25860 [Agrobacterium sp. TS45]KVK63190.1 hypothetical protein L907_25475 [Agrobacterium sp. C13]KVK63909.1 hypothetical protein L905_19360 [Agrobacterium sp. TS43]
MITRRTALTYFAGVSLATILKERAMAAEWTAESFEAHIRAFFDDIEAKANAASSTSQIGPLRDQLNREWLGAKPGAFLPPDMFDQLRARLGVVEDVLTDRFVALRGAGGTTQADERIVIERDGPVTATFFYARHYLNKDQPWDDTVAQQTIQLTEERLGIEFPRSLRDLYTLQNGGHTDFYLSSTEKTPPYEFGGSSHADIDDAYDIWFSALPGMDITPLQSLQTLGSFSDTIDFGEVDDAWRSYIPGIDRLIPISSHGSDTWLCLDYRKGSTAPKVVLFDDTKGERSGKNMFAYEAPDFASFFAGLRRHAITIENGLRMRGLRALAEGR